MCLIYERKLIRYTFHFHNIFHLDFKNHSSKVILIQGSMFQIAIYNHWLLKLMSSYMLQFESQLIYELKKRKVLAAFRFYKFCLSVFLCFLSFFFFLSFLYFYFPVLFSSGFFPTLLYLSLHHKY